MDDMELLQEFANRHSEEAFRTLVERHIDLVYSLALRQLSDPHAAEEATQTVFIDLAAKARTLPHETILAGWLFRAGRFAAAKALRSELRRQRWEREAAQMEPIIQETKLESQWEGMEPILNEALEALPEKDRCAILLRFFEKKGLKEVGAAMGLNEAAAKKRVSRAVERLRIIFQKRGIALPSAVLLTGLSAQTLPAAPAGLASTIAAAAILKGTALSTSTLTIGKGIIKLMTLSKFKTAVAVAVVLLAAGTAMLTLNHLKQIKAAPPRLEGSWAGVLQADGVTLKLLLKVAKTADGAYAATMDSFDQGVRDVPVTSVLYTNPQVRVELKTLDAEYEGRLDRRGSAMSGQWRQLGRSYPLLLKRTTPASAENVSQPSPSYRRRAGSDLQGYWKGTLAAGDRELRTVVKISEPADGAFIGAMDSIDQGIKDIPITAIHYDKPGVRLELGGIGGFFEGDLNNDATEISGTLEKEGGPALPLVLKRFDPPESEPSSSK